jgi:cytochrome c peroxidase
MNNEMTSRARSVLLCGVVIVAARSQDRTLGLTRAEAFRRAQALASLGRKMFFDASLSASGKIACSSCHDPAYAYGPPTARPVQPGGKNGKQSGMRAAPSLKYLQVIPPFTEHYFASEATGNDSVDNGPTGGLTWDGRVDRGRDQACIPLLSPYEMANDSPASVVARVRKASYAAELIALSGANQDSGAAFDTIVEAFEAWEQDDQEFYPYTSKYDAWLAGKARLSEVEQRGLKLFTDPDKGNCARCHIATRGANGTPPQFTDYGLIALGVPRNGRISANANSAWYDLGLCGPERQDLQSRVEYCGRFMTPSLRNVATRKALFHNGVFHTLKEVVEFYVRRDTNPEKWYPRNLDGTVRKFNDLPVKYHGNVEMDPPFGRSVGAKPALTDNEIQDVIAFLKTLTDGFRAPY